MKKALFNLINLILNVFYGRNIKISTLSGSFFLKTTFGHPLKRYLIKFSKYDRLLPYLSKAISKSVIDIGSNIGDTLVLIKSVSPAEVICVEPDSNFINYLNLNISLNKFRNIKVYPFPISSSNKKVIIEKNILKSTSNTSETKHNNFPMGIQTKSFSDLINELSIDIKSIGIIKIDTDGYDWDCLNSIADFYELNKADQYYPEFIFYEHQTYLNNLGLKDPDREKREELYMNSIRRLISFGYSEFYIFDNFGTLILQTKNLDDLIQIVKQVKISQTTGSSSIFFLDVLMGQPGKNHIVENALSLQDLEKMIIS